MYMANRQMFQRIALGIGLVVVLIVGVLIYNVFRTPAQASGPITAIPLAETTPAPPEPTLVPEPTATLVVAEPTTAVPSNEAEETPTAVAPEATPTAEPTPTEVVAAQAEPVTLRIVQDESEVRFIIDEVLNGAPKTVVGTTNQVAGEIEIDPNDPTRSRVGIIQINARTFVTDSKFRNRAIQNEILETGAYEFITFTPSEIVGLPSSGSVGEEYTFQIIGDLTIRDVTRQVTFDVTMTAVSETQLEGTARTTILYPDYEIRIPQVRQVASVEDEVGLELDFVAVAQ
jgi:polyisoprenoid-binding protein YceI